MRTIAAMAFKDMRILLRDRTGFFFMLFWPLVMAILFGTMFGGGGARERASAIPIVLVDEDQSEESQAFIDRLQAGSEFAITILDREGARESVRRRKAVAYVVLESGFGEASSNIFYGDPPEIELGVDPGRSASGAMVGGILMNHAAERMQETFSDVAAQRRSIEDARTHIQSSPDLPPDFRRNLEHLYSDIDRFLADGSVAADTAEAAEEGFSGFQLLAVERIDVAGEDWSGPKSAYAITFPQGVIWGMIGTAAGFAISLVLERTRGTLLRLQTAPITRMHILAGKALACFMSIVSISAGLYVLAFFAFKVTPGSIALLVLAIFSSAVAFVGVMMLLSVLGRTEQAVGGIGWAVLLVMSMLGGGMIPLFFMPEWMRTVGHASPVQWSILAMEGAVWRGFSLNEMMMPCGILLAVGVACFALGVRVFSWTTQAQ